MSAAHTPGPWAYSKKSEPGNVVFDIHQEDGAPYTRNLSDVAYSTYANELGGIQEANARLIAAAPELLEALKKVLKHEQWHAAVADEVTPEARAAIKQAEAAIAKATGAAS